MPYSLPAFVILWLRIFYSRLRQKNKCRRKPYLTSDASMHPFCYSKKRNTKQMTANSFTGLTKKY